MTLADMVDARKVHGTWGRLRRRKVVQWGLAYAAASWTLLEALGFVIETYGWTYSIRQVATLLVALGLPIALILAWYHGDRGQQRVTGAELTVITLLVASSGGLLWFYAQRAMVDSSSSPAAPIAAWQARGPDTRPSIAVLPFENRSNLQDDAFFVDGIHDDILTQLSQVSALRVISRTSVQQFRGTTLPLRTIAERLGVTTVLEGGVQRAGDRVRINVQLIDANNDDHLWAQTYDRELSAANIFALQSEIASAITHSLRARLTPAEQARVEAVATESLEAWEAYQLGRQRLARRSTEALQDAMQFFEQAIAIDPDFALGHAGLAQALLVQAYYSEAQLARPLLERAQAAAQVALKLVPSLAEAHAVRASAFHDQMQLDRAEREFRKAIELNPNYASAHHWYSMLLADLGRDVERLQHAEQAIALDPLSAIVRNNLGNALAEAGRGREAMAAYRRSIEIDPGMPIAYSQVGWLHYTLGRLDLAAPWLLKAVEIDPALIFAHQRLVTLWIDLGDLRRAEEQLRAGLRTAGKVGELREPAVVIQLFRGEPLRSSLEELVELQPRSSLGLSLLWASDVAAGRTDAALARYAAAYPELAGTEAQHVYRRNADVATDVAHLLRLAGQRDRAERLIVEAERTLSGTSFMTRRVMSRHLEFRLHAARGNTARALETLRAEVQSGWRGPMWRYYRDFDPVLASIRDEPAFKAAFAEIERDLARQRTALLARRADGSPEVAEQLR